MKACELIAELAKCNPEAEIVLRDKFDDAEGRVVSIETDPAATPATTSMVMVWGDFN